MKEDRQVDEQGPAKGDIEVPLRALQHVCDVLEGVIVAAFSAGGTSKTRTNVLLWRDDRQDSLPVRPRNISSVPS